MLRLNGETLLPVAFKIVYPLLLDEARYPSDKVKGWYLRRASSWSDWQEHEMYAPDDMCDLCLKRQAIADEDLEDDGVRRADCDMMNSLHAVLEGFSANGGDFSWLVEGTGRKRT